MFTCTPARAWSGDKKDWAPQRRSQVKCELGKMSGWSDRLKALRLISTDSEPEAGLGLLIQSSGECGSCARLSTQRYENE